MDGYIKRKIKKRRGQGFLEVWEETIEHALTREKDPVKIQFVDLSLIDWSAKDLTEMADFRSTTKTNKTKFKGGLCGRRKKHAKKPNTNHKKSGKVQKAV